MKKYVFLLTLIVLVVGVATKSFSSDQQSSDKQKLESGDYYRYIRDNLKYNVSNLYDLYSKWDDSGEITLSFRMFSNCKLNNSSVKLLDNSTGSQSLKNLVILALEKIFPVKPFPKPLRQYNELSFKMPILIKSKVRMIKGKLAPWQIGVTITNINDDIRKIYDLDIKEGVFITGIYEDSPALAVGLRPGDIIYSVDNTRIKTVKDFVKSTIRPSGNIRLTTNRGEMIVKRNRVRGN